VTTLTNSTDFFLRVRHSIWTLLMAWFLLIVLPSLVLDTVFHNLMAKDEEILRESLFKRLQEEYRQFQEDQGFRSFLRHRLKQLGADCAQFESDPQQYLSEFSRRFAQEIGGPPKFLAVLFPQSSLPVVQTTFRKNQAFQTSFHCHDLIRKKLRAFLKGDFEPKKPDPTLEKFFRRRFGNMGVAAFRADLNTAQPIFDSHRDECTLVFRGEFHSTSSRQPIALFVAIPQRWVSLRRVLSFAFHSAPTSRFRRFIQKGSSLSAGFQEWKEGLMYSGGLSPELLRECLGRKIDVKELRCGVYSSETISRHPFRGWLQGVRWGLALLILGSGLFVIRIFFLGGTIPLSLRRKILLFIGIGVWMPVVGLFLMFLFHHSSRRWAMEQEVMDHMETRLIELENHFQYGQTLVNRQILDLGRFLQDIPNPDLEALKETIRKISPHSRQILLLDDFLQLRQSGFDLIQERLLEKLLETNLSEILLQSGALEKNFSGKKLQAIQNTLQASRQILEGLHDVASNENQLQEAGILSQIPLFQLFQQLCIVFFRESPLSPPRGAMVVTAYPRYFTLKLFDQTTQGRQVFREKLHNFDLRYVVFLANIHNPKQVLRENCRPKKHVDQKEIHDLLWKAVQDKRSFRLYRIDSSPISLGVGRFFGNGNTYGAGMAIPQMDHRVSDVLHLLGIGLLIVFVISAIALSMAATLTRSLKSCIRAVKETAQGNFAWQLEIQTGDELEDLAGTLNQMVEGVRERERLERFVSAEARSALESVVSGELLPGGERAMVTILFLELVSSAPLSHESSQADWLSRINDVFTIAEGCLQFQGGTIDKFIGTTLMAVFHERRCGSDHSVSACRAALAINRALDDYNRSQEAAGSTKLLGYIGLASGSVISGRVGSKRGRLDFTVIGDAVNTAARVKAHAKTEKRRILACSNTVQHLPQDLIPRPVGAIELKGKSQAVSLFEILVREERKNPPFGGSE